MHRRVKYGEHCRSYENRSPGGHIIVSQGCLQQAPEKKLLEYRCYQDRKDRDRDFNGKLGVSGEVDEAFVGLHLEIIAIETLAKICYEEHSRDDNGKNSD